MPTTDWAALSPEVREAMRLALAVVLGSSEGLEHPGNTLVDGFSSQGHMLVNNHVISAVDAINAASHLASHLYSEHAGTPMEALKGDLQMLALTLETE